MYTTILIIVLGFNTSQSGATTIQVPFQKMEQCLAAKSQIETQLAQRKKESYLHGLAIASSGCYEQGRVQ